MLRPRAPRFASFHLHVHIHRIIGHAPRRVAIRTFDERLLAYEVAQDFVLDHLPRSRRASFPRYRPNSDRVMVEYLGRGAYLVAGEVTTRSRVTGRRRHRAFEVIVEQNHRGWELVEIYLER